MNPQQATSDLYERFREPLKSFIAKRVSDSTIVEDLVHDVFVRIHSRIDTLKEPDKVTSWIYQIARNSIIDFYRTRKVTTSGVTEDLLQVDPQELSDATERLVPVVRGMIGQLPEKYREALQLADLEGVKQSDIAKRLGISLSGVKSRVQRARLMLKDLLLQCCHFEFDRYGTIFDYSERDCSRCNCDQPKGTQALDCDNRPQTRGQGNCGCG